ncbi:MAG: SPASM domain-containing protein [Terracidiphilus sp.]
MATVIFKATDACNAQCVYCDVAHNENAIREKMPYEMLELFFSRINDYLLAKPDDTMGITWHGGEPLLLGPDYFAKALEFQQKHCEKTAHRIRHNIQTNLTLFKREYVPVFKQLGVTNFGTSYDPYTDLRGIGATVDANLYKRKFIESARLVEREGFSWGMIYVVTKLSLSRPLDIFWFLMNLNPLGSVMFNPVYLRDKKLSYLDITPEEFADFLGAIFPVWWKNRWHMPTVEPFRMMEESLIRGSRAMICCDSGICAKTHFGVAPDGAFFQCGRSMEWGLLGLGSIRERSFVDVLEDPAKAKMLKRTKLLGETECKGCGYWDVCHGGCPLDGWLKTGSLMSRSRMCAAKKIFLEKYFEPAVNGDGSQKKAVENCRVAVPAARASRPAGDADEKQNGAIWINLRGTAGDALMLSGVLKQVADRFPQRKFNLVSRAGLDPILRGHPAIGEIGHPPADARIMSADYWEEPGYGNRGSEAGRAYQTLARMFGLELPVDERLWTANHAEKNRISFGLPWKAKSLLLCPAADSARKQMSIKKWEELVELLSGSDTLIVQAGKRSAPYIRGTYSLLGLADERELIPLLQRFDAVVTVDNFAMHAAHLCGVPAVVLWGPTDHRVSGYSGQRHFQAAPGCGLEQGCMSSGSRELCCVPCPQGHDHCLDSLNLQEIGGAVREILAGKKEKPWLGREECPAGTRVEEISLP